MFRDTWGYLFMGLYLTPNAFTAIVYSCVNMTEGLMTF